MNSIAIKAIAVVIAIIVAWFLLSSMISIAKFAIGVAIFLGVGYVAIRVVRAVTARGSKS